MTKLRDVCYSRSGDKGNVSNIVVLPHKHADWEWIREVVTVELIRPAFEGLVFGEIERFELPGIGALNFVLHGALGGGVSGSLRADPHGKSLQSLILDVELPARSLDVLDERRTK
jgi:hypothetical protein